jgi:tetratricopeptide (TPR) repeat protein
MVSENQAQPAAPANGAQGGATGQQAGMASVRDTIERAKNNPTDFDAQVAAARMFDQIGRVKEEIPFLEQAYKADRSQAVSMNIPPYLAEFYSSEKDYQNAEKWYRAQLDAKPNDTEITIELGATFIDREPPNPDKAIDYLQSVLKSSPTNAHALVHLTQAYLLKKDARAAEDSLARARQSDPGNKMIPELEKQVNALKSGQQVVLPKE